MRPRLQWEDEPETRPISQEQLLAEVKGIYAGLVMVENKCMELDRGLSAKADFNNTELQQSMVTLRRKLHQDHHDFSPASRHSSVVWCFPGLPSKTHVMSFSRPLKVDSFGLPSLVGDVGDVGTHATTFDLISQRMLQLLYIASQSLDGADAELLKWMQKTEVIFDRLSKRFWGDRFQISIYIFAFYHFFFEFPSGIRHLCTTMPWTIWPSLVVLWGVCWMFIQQQHGGADKGISLLRQQGRHVDTEGMYSQLDLHLIISRLTWI